MSSLDDARNLRPDTTPEQELASLARLLDIGEGHFSLSVALCNSTTWRDQLIARLREQHDGIVTVDLPENVGDVYHYVRDRQPEPPGAALFVTGLERSARARADYQPELRATNAARELWEGRYTCPVVFWLPEDTADLLPRHAPDLHRYISHFFYFLPPPRAAGGLDLLPALEPVERGRQWMTSLAEDDERADELSRRLEEIGSEPPPALVTQTSVWMQELAEIRMRQGRGTEALALAQDAVALLDTSAALDPVDRASAYNTLSNTLRDAGLIEEATRALQTGLLCAEDAGGVMREPMLVAALEHNLANRLQEMGDPDGALAAAERSVAAFRGLAAQEPARFTVHLAGALVGLSDVLLNALRTEPALVAAEEAVALLRGAEVGPATGDGEDLLRALVVLAHRLIVRNRTGEAAAVLDEVSAVAAEVAQCGRDVTASLHALRSYCWMAAGRYEEAVDEQHQAVTDYRALHRQSGGRRGVVLAQSLMTYANALSAVGRHSRAADALTEALTALGQDDGPRTRQLKALLELRLLMAKSLDEWGADDGVDG